MKNRAFSLVEMLIVIAIIAVLVALTATVGVRFKEKAEIDEARNLLKKLEVILQEWETRSGRDLMWGENTPPPNCSGDPPDGLDLHEDTPHVFGMTELLKTVGRPRQIKDMIGQIKPAFVHCYNCLADPDPITPFWLPTNPSTDDPDPEKDQARTQYDGGCWDGDLTILDVWGIPIRIIHPGRVWINGTDDPLLRNDDGTLFTEQEFAYGVAIGRRICFVSAGPDGKFGDLQLDPNASASPEQKLLDQAADNIYSYEVQKP